MSLQQQTQITIPPIDQTILANIETATFGLG